MAPGQRVRPPRTTQSSSTTKEVRKLNKGKGLECLIKKAGHPLNLNISLERRPVGENHELLSREIGILTRYHAPLKRVGWLNVSKTDKEALYEQLKLKFNLDFTQSHVDGCVELLFASSYKSFRHRCYNHYLKSGGGDDARRNPYKPLADRTVDWLWLCDHFETEQFQKRSATGTINRSKLPYVHKKGTKPFVALQHELSCGEISLYKECYCTQKGWSSTDAREKYEKMLQMQQQAEQEGGTPLTEQQICERVLGKAYGYIRGRGHGPKPNRRAASSSSSTNAHVVEELAATKEIVAAQQTRIESQQKQIDWLSSVVSKLAGVPPPMDDNDAPRSTCTITTSIDGNGPPSEYSLR